MDSLFVKDEKELVRKCQAGDLGCFGVLYDAYLDKIYNFVFYRTGNKELAEDLVSQTFFKAIRNIAKFDGENFSAWLYRIARNTVIDNYRTSKTEEPIENLLNLSEGSDLIREIDKKVKLEEVQKILSKLKKEQQEIVLMKVWDGLSYKEIAEIMGKSEASCKMMFSRTLSLLKEEMSTLLLLLIMLKTF